MKPSTLLLIAAMPLIPSAAVAQSRIEPPPVGSSAGRPLPDGPLSPQAAVYVRSGDKSLRLGEVDQAILSYARAAEVAPNALLPRLSLGVTLSAVRKTELAVKQYRAATRIAEDDLITALLLQGALQEYGDLGTSQQVYLDTVRRFTRPGKPGLDASLSLMRLEAALQTFPDSPVVALLLGDAYQVAVRFDDAGKQYRRAIALAPQWQKPRVNYGLALLAQGKSTQAIDALQGVLKQDPSNPQVQLAMADAQFQLGHSSEALRTYRKLTNTPGIAVLAATGAARASYKLGDVPQAIRSLENARRLAPNDPTPVAALADIHRDSRNFAAAADSYAAALKLSTEGGLFTARPSLQRALAEAQLAANRPDDALNTLQIALREDPDSAPLWHRLLARVYDAQSDLPSAEMELKRALSSDIGLYPIDTLNAIAAKGWTEKFIASYRADLQGARTGLRGGTTGTGGISIATVPKSRDAELIALNALGHLLRFTHSSREEVSLRRELVGLRGTGTDWFLLAQAQERIGENADARTSYGEAVRKGDLSAAAQRAAIQRIRALASLPPHSEQQDE